MALDDLGEKLSRISTKEKDIFGMGMPHGARTTSTKEEFKGKKILWGTKIFPINNNVDAADYASFMNWVLSNPKARNVVREDSTWTKDGELVRVVDFTYEEGDVYGENQTSIKDNKPLSSVDITRTPSSEALSSSEGKKFTDDDFVQE